jgi:hypothetical protein
MRMGLRNGKYLNDHHKYLLLGMKIKIFHYNNKLNKINDHLFKFIILVFIVIIIYNNINMMIFFYIKFMPTQS